MERKHFLFLVSVPSFPVIFHFFALLIYFSGKIMHVPKGLAKIRGGKALLFHIIVMLKTTHFFGFRPTCWPWPWKTGGLSSIPPAY